MEETLVKKTKDEKVLSKYSRDEVYQATLDYFNGDTLATEVWINKYCLKDSDGNLYEKTPDDMHWRLANEFARIENKYPNPLSVEEIYNKIKKFKKIVPQGSPMAGIGNDFQTISISNCFVVGNGEDADSYGGIFEIDQKIAQLQKRRAGVGINLDFIRPNGSPVKNSALTSTGVVPFMERFSNTTREVAQGGRRGALLEAISIKHPDSEDFIDAKLQVGKVTGANVSVKIDDEFMDAVLNNKTYTTQYPVESDKPIFTKEINANKLWKKIIHNAWKSAEPGCLFFDTILKESIPDCYSDLGFKTVSVNPCFSGNEQLLTTQGYKSFEELDGIDTIQIINKNGDIVNSKVWKSGVKDTIKLYNTQNEEIICTPDHKWMTNDGQYIEAKNLIGKKLLPYLNLKKTHDDLFLKLGFIQGDANLTRLKSETHKGFEINIGDNDDDVLELFGFIRKENKQRIFYSDDYYTICQDLKFHSEVLPKRNLPENINNWSINEKKAFLSGLFSANGSIVGNYRISFKSTNKNLIIDLQKIFIELGISTYYTTNKEKEVKFLNGTYKCKESYDLNIGKYYDLIKFYNEIGFIHNYKNKKLKNIILNRSPKIRKIEKYDKIDVYDFTEPLTNWGVVNGYIAHNCGEITLCESDSCRLLAINLYSYVKNPFTNEAYFDFEEFKKDCEISERLMDDIVDLEIEKVNKILNKIGSDPESDKIKEVEKRMWLEIKEKAEMGRRTGFGITGEGDMVAALGLKYGTDEANDFCEEVHKQLKLSAYHSSVIMAKERGAFPIYSNEREKNNPFINRIKNEDPDLYEMMTKYGRRNIALLTIAPTGSVSIMTQTSSGIECVFLPYYTRRRKINPSDKNVRVDFIDEVGDHWMEYPVFHHKFETWLEVNGYDIENIKNNYSKDQIDELIKLSPYYKATSNDVDWVKKVEMQGRIQKHIDHSISVTVNLPNNISEEIVSKVYEMGYKSGCKGITVYRDGSRSGVLVSSDEKKEKEKKKLFEDNHAPKRPKRLNADIVRFQNNHEKWVAVVGLLDNRPYEIFTGKLSNGLSELSSSITKCDVVKNKDENGNKSYDIEYIDSNKNKHVYFELNNTFNPEYWNYSKMISGVLRHGMPLVYVLNLIQSLNLDDDHLNTWKNGVARVIKRYIKDGDMAVGMKCENCGSKNVVFKEGCAICMDCGSSKCN